MGVRHGERYEVCNKCSKRGIYPSNGYPYWGDGTKCCRYCNNVIRPAGAATKLTPKGFVHYEEGK